MWDLCLGSYYHFSLVYGNKPCRLPNGNRHYVEFVHDEPDEFFVAVVKRIKGAYAFAFTLPFPGKHQGDYGEHVASVKTYLEKD